MQEKYYLNSTSKILLISLLFLGLWFCLAPINSSVIANGKIVLSNQKKTISHLYGGIIKDIFVNEGNIVKKNDPLIEFDTTQIKSKIQQNINNIEGFEKQKQSNESQAKSIKEELRMVDKMLKYSGSSVTKKMELERKLDELKGSNANILAQIESTKNEQIINQHILENSIIKSPVDGQVMDIQYQTIGETIPNATRIMFISPIKDELIAEVMISPKDIDLITLNMNAKIQILAYKAKIMPKLEGKVINISPDSMQDNTGNVFYKVRVSISKSELSKFGEIKIVPGMMVSAFIITGSRSVIKYLISPIYDSAYRSFRER